MHPEGIQALATEKHREDLARATALSARVRRADPGVIRSADRGDARRPNSILLRFAPRPFARQWRNSEIYADHVRGRVRSIQARGW